MYLVSNYEVLIRKKDKCLGITFALSKLKYYYNSVRRPQKMQEVLRMFLSKKSSESSESGKKNLNANYMSYISFRYLGIH